MNRPPADEAQVLATADLMSARLSAHGYDLLILDQDWCVETDARGRRRRCFDPHGRPAPVEARFPSSSGRRGLAPLAAALRARGLRLGVHLDRGVPFDAVSARATVHRSAIPIAAIARAGEPAKDGDGMLGVDVLQGGAQDYYDSIFAQLTAWGVDFVRTGGWDAADLADRLELEAMRRAADASGGTITLHTAAGGAPLPGGDSRSRLGDESDRLRRLCLSGGLSPWGEANGLPQGLLDIGTSRADGSKDDIRSLVTLWAIAGAPLVFGGDLNGLDAADWALLTNDEVVAVNQMATAARPLFERGVLSAWTSRAADGSARHLAIFNRSGDPRVATLPIYAWVEIGAGWARDLWSGCAGQLEVLLSRPIPPRSSMLLKIETR